MTGAWLLVLLLGAIVFIVVMTARVRLHPFLVLLLTTLGVGLLAGVPAAQVVSAMTSGFGSTLGSIGIVIAAGTIMGYIMEKSGAALVMANSILKLVGQERSALAMAVTGGVVSIPVFCDSGFVILSPLNRSLAARSKQSLAVFAVALSMGLYSTHVFVPPTPGPIAAAGTLGADLGTVILLGLVVSVPTILAGYIFAKTYGARVHIDPKPMAEETGGEARHLPSAVRSFAPIVVPVVLIALKSVADYPTNPLGAGTLRNFISFVGNPNVALLIGVFLAFLTVERLTGEVMGDWVSAGLKDAGMIILITGAGGALGAVLRETAIADYITSSLSGLQFGILLPFILAAAIKTAQGSSTVAIITTAGIVSPILGALGLAGGVGPALAVMAIGAGAMTVSHANDSYFWVVAQFSDMKVSEAYRLQTLASLVTGIVGLITVTILYLIFV
ncbi:MAG TPA: GntP family permease [Firmicutes bacterium]|jgi:GntP family gluconate:H+ symporter|nr:MAG: gluconate transporter [Peptococcaceae bacterium 1109]HHT73629.1 GntP family permease [Bacillota bacterium]